MFYVFRFDRACPRMKTQTDPASPKQRGMCRQFVWLCLGKIRLSNLKMLLIPEDMSKQQVGEMFKKVVCQVGQLPTWIVCRSSMNHTKSTIRQPARERQYHIIFQARFAQHLQALKTGGNPCSFFPFNLVGYQAYLRYCVELSAEKPGRSRL